MNEKREQLVRELYESRMKVDVLFQQNRMPNLPGIDFGVPQLGILFGLNYMKDQRASVKELTEMTHKSSSAITQLVEGLEEGGFVERIHSTDDRRVVFVHMTEKGEEKFADFYANLITAIGEITKVLSNEEIMETVRINNKLADQI